jgi:hypothetical protein
MCAWVIHSWATKGSSVNTTIATVAVKTSSIEYSRWKELCFGDSDCCHPNSSIKEAATMHGTPIDINHRRCLDPHPLIVYTMHPAGMLMQLPPAQLAGGPVLTLVEKVGGTS